MNAFRAQNKFKKRAGTISAGVTRYFVAPFLNTLVSLAVIRIFSKELWGELVQPILFIQLAAQFLSFGSREYLLKSLSMEPARIRELWLRSLSSRWILFLPVALAAFVFCPDLQILIIVALWIMFRQVSHHFETLMLYQRDFIRALMFEAASAAVIILPVSFFINKAAVESILLLFAAGELLKSTLYLLLYHKLIFPLKIYAPEKGFFTGSLPFFLLSFSGILMSKTDQLCVNLLMPADSRAEYQVFTNFLYMAISLPGLLLGPYLKNLYRLGNNPWKGVRSAILRLAIFFVPGYVIVAGYVTEMLFRFPVDAALFFVAVLYVLPAFQYTPLIYFLFQKSQQSSVVVVTYACVVINAGLCIIMIPLSGISGALWSGAITNIALMIALNLLCFRLKDPSGKTFRIFESTAK